MDLLNIARDNLLDIICYVASDPSPRNVLWVRNIALSCKTLCELTKHSNVWIELSKSWFQAKHSQSNRIGFIAEVFRYNYPNGKDEYNFTKKQGDCPICKDLYRLFYRCSRCGRDCGDIPVYLVDTPVMLHSMLVCAYRFDKKIPSVYCDEKEKCAFDSYHITLAKNISYSTEYVEFELRKYNPAVFALYDKFKNKSYNCAKMFGESSLPSWKVISLLCELEDMIPDKHFTKQLDPSSPEYNNNNKYHVKKFSVSSVKEYFNKFAPIEMKVDSIKSILDSGVMRGDINIFKYLAFRSWIFLVDIYFYCKKGFKYISKTVN